MTRLLQRRASSPNRKRPLDPRYARRKRPQRHPWTPSLTQRIMWAIPGAEKSHVGLISSGLGFRGSSHARGSSSAPPGGSRSCPTLRQNAWRSRNERVAELRIGGARDGWVMVEVPPEIKKVIDQQEASLQRIAMWNYRLTQREPGRRNRPCKIRSSRKRFSRLRSIRSWPGSGLISTSSGYTRLLLDMEAGGGGRRTLDAMTELAEVSLSTQA